MEHTDSAETDQSGKKRPRGDETDSPEEQSSKLQQVETLEDKNDSAESNEPFCSFCMDEGNPTNPLLPNHQCPQCAPNAWHVCLVCNEALLSRLCPMCRAEYAPIVMHKVPGLPFKKLADTSLSEDEKSTLLYKFGIVRQMISKSNVAVWSNEQQRLFFSLPAKTVDPKSVDTNDESSFIIASVPLTSTLANEEIFNFTNSIWDLLENEVENGASQAGFSVDYKGATQWILNVTKEENHVVFTMLSPSDWEYMLNPDACTDTTEALKSICMNILKQVESIIPAATATVSKQSFESK